MCAWRIERPVVASEGVGFGFAVVRCGRKSCPASCVIVHRVGSAPHPELVHVGVAEYAREMPNPIAAALAAFPEIPPATVIRLSRLVEPASAGAAGAQEGVDDAPGDVESAPDGGGSVPARVESAPESLERHDEGAETHG